MSNYKWENEDEKELVLRKMQTEYIVTTRDKFLKILTGDMILDGDTRYRVWAMPSGYQFDPKSEDGVPGPLEAIQGAIELHVDGGWNWLVWDLQKQIGFTIEANSYIYAPLEAHYAEHYSPKNFHKRSTVDLREIAEAARGVLAARKEHGAL